MAACNGHPVYANEKVTWLKMRPPGASNNLIYESALLFDLLDLISIIRQTHPRRPQTCVIT